jgi:lysophospholipase L1-like esterase
MLTTIKTMGAEDERSPSWKCPRRRVALLTGVSVVVVTFLTQLFGNAVSTHNFGVSSLSSLDIFTKTPNSPHGSTTKDDEAASTPSEIWEGLWDKMGLMRSIAEQHQPQELRTSNGSLFSTLTTTGSNVQHLGLQDLFGLFPRPIQPEILQIYNQTTYQDLVLSLVAARNNKNSTFTICANGGSVSAGGGGIALPGRYYSILARYLSDVMNDSGSTTQSPEVMVLNRAHGTRHSLHSAIFAPYNLPYASDLLLWEFAINDYGYRIPDEMRVQQVQSILLAWLREAEQLKPRPPKVILIYLWRRPFSPVNDEDQRIDNPVFALHEQLARRFDFVVGHVNLASYLDELNPPDFDTLKQVFLADAHHPNQAGHSAIAFLLMSFLRGTGAGSNSPSNANNIDTMEHNRTLTSPSSHQSDDEEIEIYNWYCGNETTQKRFLQSRIISQPQRSGGGVDAANSGWRSPLGTITLEVPQPEPCSRPRQLILDNRTGRNTTITILGKQDPLRIDRQRSAALECCSFSSHKDTAHITDAFTTIRLVNSTEVPMRGVQAIFFGFGTGVAKVDDIKVYLNAEPTVTAATLLQVVPEEWPCFWSWQDLYKPYWLILSKEQPSVSSMSFCVENSPCRRKKPSDALLLSMAVY